MSLPENQIIQGLHAANAANLQFDNIRDFESQIEQISPDATGSPELQELTRKKLRAARLYNQYVEMGGLFFGRQAEGAADDPVLSGESLPRID